MKSLIIAAALAGLAVANPLSAQGRTTSTRIIPGSTTNRQDCAYNQTNPSVGGVIFGRNGTRTNSSNCRSSRSGRTQSDGSWYQVGQDNYGNTIYERRVRDANGNLVIQRARRDSYGNMTIISSRNIGNNGTWSNNNRDRGDNDGDNDDQGDNDRSGKWSNNARSSHDNKGNSERHGHGRGKGHKGRD
ncbi:MAG: hypothetical protein ABR582_11550 [Gemmatimonadaceae bacterium]